MGPIRCFMPSRSPTRPAAPSRPHSFPRSHSSKTWWTMTWAGLSASAGAAQHQLSPGVRRVKTSTEYPLILRDRPPLHRCFPPNFRCLFWLSSLYSSIGGNSANLGSASPGHPHLPALELLPDVDRLPLAASCDGFSCAGPCWPSTLSLPYGTLFAFSFFLGCFHVLDNTCISFCHSCVLFFSWVAPTSFGTQFYSMYC